MIGRPGFEVTQGEISEEVQFDAGQEALRDEWVSFLRMTTPPQESNRLTIRNAVPTLKLPTRCTKLAR